jgi:aspartyl-tRNA(Asn)/glutamyl-tRNA(Gln) amidotransferase subunit A
LWSNGLQSALGRRRNPPHEGLLNQTIKELSRGIRARQISPAEITHQCLARIEKLNPALNAFITVLADSALDQARRAEQEIFRGKYRGPLHGIPIGLKDILDTAGTRTTAASALFKDRVPAEDAEVVRRLRCAGAVILGKQNLHEFAYGGSSLISFYGEVHNPWKATRVAGGSSGGSAASVAVGMGFAAIGTDTAGSIRLPASYCGVVGKNQILGGVRARGVIPLSPSFDHVGPLTNSVCDAGLVLQVLASYDAEYPASTDVRVTDYTRDLEEPLPALRMGISRAFFFDDLDPEVAAAIEKTIEVFGELGCEIRDDIRFEVPVDRTLSSSESWDYHKAFVARSPELYQPATLARIKSGEKLSETDVLRAKQDLAASREAIRKVFDEVDVLLTPTVPILPPSIGDLKKNPDNLRPAELIMLRNTRPFNVWGIPAISIPCGFTRDGMPIGLQLASASWQLGLLLHTAHKYEQATEWHKRVPIIGDQPIGG